MPALTKDSPILELGREAPNTRLRNAFRLDRNLERLAERNMRSVGDLLTPEGEMALFMLDGTGKSTMSALHSFLYEQGFSPNWPYTQASQVSPSSHLSRTLSLTDALKQADEHYTIKAGEPVGEFSRKIQKNTQAQQDGARLKGRRTL